MTPDAPCPAHLCPACVADVAELVVEGVGRLLVAVAVAALVFVWLFNLMRPPEE